MRVDSDPLTLGGGKAVPTLGFQSLASRAWENTFPLFQTVCAWCWVTAVLGPPHPPEDGRAEPEGTWVWLCRGRNKKWAWWGSASWDGVSAYGSPETGWTDAEEADGLVRNRRRCPAPSAAAGRWHLDGDPCGTPWAHLAPARFGWGEQSAGQPWAVQESIWWPTLDPGAQRDAPPGRRLWSRCGLSEPNQASVMVLGPPHTGLPCPSVGFVCWNKTLNIPLIQFGELFFMCSRGLYHHSYCTKIYMPFFKKIILSCKFL